jgi:peptidoglycan-N-acetylglucosamine deacetylase
MAPFPKYLTFRNVLTGMLLLWGLAVLLKAAWWLYLLVFMAALTISYFGTTQISSNFHMPAYCKAPNHHKKEIAITFDDGVTNPKQSHLVLDILKKYQAPATFFCIGKNLETNEQLEVLKRMNTEGHIIGNHSYSHSNFYDFFSSKQVIEETLLTDEIVRKHTGKTPRFFRPPYGITTPNIAKAFKALEHKTIGWSLRSLDTVIKDDQKLFERVKSKLKTGDIILFHDHIPQMKTFLPMFLEYLLKEGYTVVGADQLLGLKAYA